MIFNFSVSLKNMKKIEIKLILQITLAFQEFNYKVSEINFELYLYYNLVISSYCKRNYFEIY